MKRANFNYDKHSYTICLGVRHSLADLCWLALIVIGPFRFEYRLWADK